MKLAQVLRDAQTQIAQVSGSARLDAQLLLAHALGVDRTFVIAHGDRLLTDQELARFAPLLERALAREPIPYILEKRAFFDRELYVNHHVLIPRPETELLLERALEWTKTHPVTLAADIGTGSGALAVTYSALIKLAHVYATDISAEALAVARKNAENFDLLDRTTFIQGDLAAPLIERGIKLDLLMANLPYIPTEIITTLAPNVREYEPRVALDGGADGAELIRRLIDQIPLVCQPHALILLEIGMDQEATVRSIAQTLPGARVTHFTDYAGLDRIIQIELNEP